MYIAKFADLTAGCLLALTLATPAFASTTVNVDLWDNGGTWDLSQNMHRGMGMQGGMMMTMMGVKVDKAIVPAGKVTFEVKNVSKETIHEMLVAPIKDANATLPFIEKENRVDEEASGDLGEVSELDPGQTGALTLDLKPGLYILFCNVPGHYTAGMWTTVEVK
ncbi:plastocyanin/azurin family copper-binding protein [Ciceribacter thiooxidans]|uniref:Plastocyanin/azurin family copper-binding protein n=1 Tax=Ciceribacter thiooxidans TaxID=1969821 RepID=A0ABV7I320_9HYPH|nr:plastocyanin/azurin family copper-binding protein [Ciceribacter thiooxidans]